MDVRAALLSRRSVRAFSDRAVPIDIVRDILGLCSRSPSGSNLQPWRVYALLGQAREELIRQVKVETATLPRGEAPEYNIHPPEMTDLYRSRYQRAASLMYAAAGIDRTDSAARQRHLERNWEFFGAPVGLIFTIHRFMEPGQWSDLGMFMQSIMLMARSHGLDTCAQEAWALWPRTVRRVLGIAEDEMIVCGMALGFADESASINGFQSERAELQDYATILENIELSPL